MSGNVKRECPTFVILKCTLSEDAAIEWTDGRDVEQKGHEERSAFNTVLHRRTAADAPSMEGRARRSHACASRRSGIFFEVLAEGYRSWDDLYKFGKVGVSPRTLWRWRRVAFEALGNKKQPEQLKGIVEVDETYS